MTEQRISELVGVMQSKYVVFLTKDGRIELRDYFTEHVYHSFQNWEECEAWAVKMEWD